MRRVLPAPLLSTALFTLWLVLNAEIGSAQIVLAATVAIVVPLLCAPLRPLPVRVRRPGVAVRLIATVLHDVVVSNLEIGWRVLHARAKPPRGAFVRIPLDVHDANALATLAVITTIVPGTVWCELAIDRSAFLLHVFDVVDEATFVEHFKQRYEAPLREIFE